MICPACKAQNVDDAKFCGACGQPLAVSPDKSTTDFSSMYTVDSRIRREPVRGQLASGAVFAGRYEIRGALDGSSMTDAYLAHDRVTGSDVTLKLVRSELQPGAGAVQRFTREAAAARDIRHPAIAAVYDVGEADGQAYFTAEVVEGISLRDWNRRRLTSGAELGMSSISALIFAVLDALMTIHIRKLVADISPAKIMLLSDPAQADIRIKIVDVGLPLLAATNESNATAMAAQHYRAPEALTISSEALQPSADIYSLSMIFYELLTGVVLAGQWQAPGSQRTDVPTAVDALIQAGLSNAPRRRPQTAEDFGAQLKAALGAAPGPQSAPKSDPKPSPRPNPEPSPGPKVEANTWPIPNFLAPILKALNMPFAAILVMIQSMVGWLEVLTFAGRTPQLGTRKAVRRGLTILVSALLLVGAGYAVWGLSRLADDNDAAIAKAVQKPETPGPAFSPTSTPTEAPQPPKSQYAAFQGYWTDDFGDTWSVGVDQSGHVRAAATGGYFAGSQMIGAFSGRRFQFAVGNAYGAGEAIGTFDGGCHIKYQTSDPSGSGRTVNVQFHINHQPGAPCP